MSDRAGDDGGAALREPYAELLKCIEILKPYIGRPIGAPGSFARREQEDRSWSYTRAKDITVSLAARKSGAGHDAARALAARESERGGR